MWYHLLDFLSFNELQGCGQLSQIMWFYVLSYKYELYYVTVRTSPLSFSQNSQQCMNVGLYLEHLTLDICRKHLFFNDLKVYIQ